MERVGGGRYRRGINGFGCAQRGRPVVGLRGIVEARQYRHLSACGNLRRIDIRLDVARSSRVCTAYLGALCPRCSAVGQRDHVWIGRIAGGAYIVVGHQRADSAAARASADRERGDYHRSGFARCDCHIASSGLDRRPGNDVRINGVGDRVDRQRAGSAGSLGAEATSNADPDQKWRGSGEQAYRPGRSRHCRILDRCGNAVAYAIPADRDTDSRARLAHAQAARHGYQQSFVDGIDRNRIAAGDDRTLDVRVYGVAEYVDRRRTGNCRFFRASAAHRHCHDRGAFVGLGLYLPRRAQRRILYRGTNRIAEHVEPDCNAVSGTLADREAAGECVDRRVVVCGDCYIAGGIDRRRSIENRGRNRVPEHVHRNGAAHSRAVRRAASGGNADRARHPDKIGIGSCVHAESPRVPQAGHILDGRADGVCDAGKRDAHSVATLASERAGPANDDQIGVVVGVDRDRAGNDRGTADIQQAGASGVLSPRNTYRPCARAAVLAGRAADSRRHGDYPATAIGTDVEAERCQRNRTVDKGFGRPCYVVEADGAADGARRLARVAGAGIGNRAGKRRDDAVVVGVHRQLAGIHCTGIPDVRARVVDHHVHSDRTRFRRSVLALRGGRLRRFGHWCGRLGRRIACVQLRQHGCKTGLPAAECGISGCCAVRALGTPGAGRFCGWRGRWSSCGRLAARLARCSRARDREAADKAMVRGADFYIAARRERLAGIGRVVSDPVSDECLGVAHDRVDADRNAGTRLLRDRDRTCDRDGVGSVGCAHQDGTARSVRVSQRPVADSDLRAVFNLRQRGVHDDACAQCAVQRGIVSLASGRRQHNRQIQRVGSDL